MDFYGLVGEKLGHSLSPRIHEMAFDLLGVRGAYKLFEIAPQDIGKLGGALKLLGIRGVNVTIPYKQAVMAQLDALSPEAQAIGAVNTIALEQGRLIGYNTDYFGLQSLLQTHRIDPLGKTAVVLGTGGVAKAIEAVLWDGGLERLFRVSRHKASELTGLDRRGVTLDYESLDTVSGHILVNATPVGMAPHPGVSPVGPEVIQRFDVLVDMVYNPLETEFLHLGRLAGKQVCGGLYMLVAQALKAQAIWQGKPLDPAIIRAVYDKLKEELKAWEKKN
ncbi:MAG TPA: shikimate dehydrogenase [Peptococcaceae bacterium]|nr:shikimate dehydrogenase [Peptococcaceae bacterium]